MSVREVPLGEWHSAVADLRRAGYDFFDWLSAVDETDDPQHPGYDVVCHLVRTQPWEGVLIRTRVPDGGSLASITDLFPGAAWHERETHEMFGVEVDGFEDGTGLGLRPLLLPEGFEGTPLRKSFVLAARVSKPWPGAKEPGESSDPGSAPARPGRAPRRRAQPPGIPDPEWGPR